MPEMRWRCIRTPEGLGGDAVIMKKQNRIQISQPIRGIFIVCHIFLPNAREFAHHVEFMPER